MLSVRAKKILLNAFIAFHLLVLLSVPNRLSYLNQLFKGVLAPYANTLAINSEWRFFSPDPGPAVYFEIEATSSSSSDEIKNQPRSFYFPPFEDPYPYPLRPRYNRRISASRLIGQYPDFVQAVLTPYLCRTYPEFHNFSISLLTINPVSMEEVQSGIPLNDLQTHRNIKHISTEFCDSLSSEEEVENG